MHAARAAADGHDDPGHVFGARVRERDLVAQASRIKAFPRQQFTVETWEIRYVGMPVKQARDLVKRVGALGALHLQINARGN
jgi:hypothetical protein